MAPSTWLHHEKVVRSPQYEIQSTFRKQVSASRARGYRPGLPQACAPSRRFKVGSLLIAERVGVRVHVFSKPNVDNGFAIISRNRSDLVTSNLRRG